jgi:Cu/Ag efflux protein CusF
MHAMLITGLFLSLASTAAAPQKAVTKSAEVSATATVQAIDKENRMVTLKSEDGTEDTVYVPKDVKRFDAVQVGDKLKVRYYESLVFQIRKAGVPAPTTGGGPTMTSAPGAKPGATLAKQQTATVDVVSVDPAVPSITVKTADGRTITRKIEDKKNLEGVNPGDKIDITFTQAAVISMQSAGGK